MPNFTIEEGTERFEDFLTQAQYRHQIAEITDQYPEKKSIYLYFNNIESYSIDLSDFLLYHTSQAFICANKAIQNIVPPDKQDVVLSLRITNIPSKFAISKLRISELEHFVSIEGLVRRATEVRPRMVIAVYECKRCGQIIEEPQETWHPKEPLECYKEQNGCGRSVSSTRFKPRFDLSQFVNSQKIEIQEPPEGTIPGAQAERMACYAEEDVVGVANPGDRIIVNGVLTARTRSFPMKSTIFDTYLFINSIETQERIYEEITITDADEKRILALATDERCCMNIVSSLIPTVHGMYYEKEALALQLFGGVAKDMPDGSRLRGDIHILLIGDPGTAKSTILRAISKIAPRGIFTSGKTTSDVGLIASVVKDDFGEGRWTVEAGAMALADRGHLCADELDKMHPNHRMAMHEAMAQQEVYISKAGIHTLIQTRCPVLAAANPKSGRFDPTEYIVAQINMPPTLLSRFDLIFSIMDIPDLERDGQVAQHILKGEKLAQVRAYTSAVGKGEHNTESIKDLLETFVPNIEPELLRKFIAYAKRNVMPVMGNEAMERIQNYYVQMRSKSEVEGSITITPRQLQAMIRLSEASARLHLSNTIEVDRDVERAIRIMDYYLKRIAGDEGRFDIDIIECGISQSQRERMKTVRGIIQDLAATEQPVDHEDIVAEAEKADIARGKTETAIKKLMVEDGFIYESYMGSGKYRLSR